MLEGTLDGAAHQTLTDRIYQLLKENIVRHRLKPGARLLDQEIAESLNVSRTPVREALNRLGTEGLVEIIPRRGAFVINLSAKDMKDIYEVREVLEVLAVRLAVPRLSDEDILGLEETLEAFSNALDRKEHLTCFELDKEFHDRIVRLSGNAKLAEINTLLGGNIQTTRWRHCQNDHRQQLSLQEHRAILDALIKRDVDLASELVSDHIRSVKKDLLTEQEQDI
jgi:DNA-binding GntR family transcriptional regulator